MPEIQAAGPVGFLEESPGVKSMTRLCAAAMTLGVLIIIVSVAIVAVRGKDSAVTIITAAAAPLIPLAGGIWAALKERE